MGGAMASWNGPPPPPYPMYAYGYNETAEVPDTAIGAINMCDRKLLPNVHKLLQVPNLGSSGVRLKLNACSPRSQNTDLLPLNDVRRSY